MHQCQVAPLNVVNGEKPSEAPVGLIVFGHHHDAGGILVQPVHDARSGDTANAREAATAVMQQGVDKSPAPITGGRVDNKTRRLVDDNEVLVFKQDVERYVFGLGIGLPNGRRREGDHFAFSDLVGGIIHDLAPDGQYTLFNEGFDLRSGVLGPLGKPAVDALAETFGDVAGDGFSHNKEAVQKAARSVKWN